jgi:transposase
VVNRRLGTDLLLKRVAYLEARVACLQAEKARLEAEKARLEEENARLAAENAELRRRLGLNSQNSHKPPSSDGYRKKPARWPALPKE